MIQNLTDDRDKLKGKRLTILPSLFTDARVVTCDRKKKKKRRHHRKERKTAAVLAGKSI